MDLAQVTYGNLTQIAYDVNTLAGFLGRRGVPELTQDALAARYGWRQADVMALFGGSILAGGDVLAAAMRAGVARTYVIVGGAGHTTQTFRERVRGLCPDLDFSDDACEADVFAAYLRMRNGLEADLLERRSTNCGNNITYLRDLLVEHGVPCRTLILSQDATMQLRMEAVCRHDWPEAEPVSFATYATRVVVKRRAADGNGGGDAINNGDAISGGDARADRTEQSSLADSLNMLAFDPEPLGMWKPRRYLTLLMGEIPRLTDDEHGYGPHGKDFLVHVDIPDEVMAAFDRLRAAFPGCVRAANPRFATR